MKNLRLLLLSLLTACFVWVMHTFSLDYSASMSYAVCVTTNLKGYAPDATARETLVVRGRGTGFYILKMRGLKRKPATLPLTVDARLFTLVSKEEGVFRLNVADIRDKISEQLGERFIVDFIETPQLSFSFTPQSYARVPVVAVLDLSFRPQYMQVGEVQLMPDSVLVYGDVKELQKLTQVGTGSISFRNVDKSLQGYVPVEPVPGLRIDCEKVYYDITVDRYVETTLTVPVTATHVPAGRTLMILPSQAEVTFRASFRPRGGRITAEDLSLVVDWRDYVKAGSTHVIPKLETQRDIYSWRMKPEMLECILVAGK